MADYAFTPSHFVSGYLANGSLTRHEECKQARIADKAISSFSPAIDTALYLPLVKFILHSLKLTSRLIEGVGSRGPSENDVYKNFQDFQTPSCHCYSHATYQLSSQLIGTPHCGRHK